MEEIYVLDDYLSPQFNWDAYNKDLRLADVEPQKVPYLNCEDEDSLERVTDIIPYGYVLKDKTHAFYFLKFSYNEVYEGNPQLEFMGLNPAGVLAWRVARQSSFFDHFVQAEGERLNPNEGKGKPVFTPPQPYVPKASDYVTPDLTEEEILAMSDEDFEYYGKLAASDLLIDVATTSNVQFPTPSDEVCIGEYGKKMGKYYFVYRYYIWVSYGDIGISYNTAHLSKRQWRISEDGKVEKIPQEWYFRKQDIPKNY